MGRATVGLALMVLLPVAAGACSEPTRRSLSSTDPVTSGASTSLSGAGIAASGTPAGATAGVTGEASAGPTSTQQCDLAVGPQLRERTTVTVGGTVSMRAGILPCRSVGVWVSSFTLDDDPAADPTPRFAGLYTGIGPLSARLLSVTGRCSASAVYFSATAEAAKDTSQAATAAAGIRSDLAYWPSGEGPTVPGGAILQGRPSGVLAATVTGDPSRCSPGENLATPLAAVGDCWLSGTAAPGSPEAQPSPAGGGFRKTPCTAAHTHEVYWAESLTTAEYLQQTTKQREGAAAWARNRASDVCSARSSSIRLAHGVTMTEVFLELLWPSNLEYPPTSTVDWSRAQIVCLARWKNGKASTRQLLSR